MENRDLEILGDQLTTLIGRVESAELQLHQQMETVSMVVKTLSQLQDRVLLIERNWE